MHWKTLFSVCALGFSLLPSPPAWAASNSGPGVALTATGSVASAYLFRGLRRNGASLQPGLEAEAGPLTVGAWGNLPFHHKVRGSADPEIDLYGSYAFTMAPAATIVPGFTTCWYPETETNGRAHRATFEPNLACNYTHASGVRLTPKVYYDTVLRGPTYELSAAYAYPVGGWGTELDFTGTVGTYRWTDYASPAASGLKAWGDYWLLGVGAPFQFAPHQKITLNFTYTEGRRAFTKRGSFPRSPNALAAGRGVVTLTYGVTF